MADWEHCIVSFLDLIDIKGGNRGRTFVYKLIGMSGGPKEHLDIKKRLKFTPNKVNCVKA